jgi:vitamin B12 transporter
LHASAGRAIVNPGFASIFGTDGNFPSIGNPNLVPEENRGYEVGIELPFANVNGFLDITYFNETLTDEIEYIRVPNPYNYVNQEGESDRSGIELITRMRPTQFVTIGGSYTYLDATEPDGSRETRRPGHELGLTADLRIQPWNTLISSNIRHVRGLYDNQFWDGGETGAELPNFTTVDFAASHMVSEQIELFARLNNAFDEDYEEVWSYATRGRAGYVGVRASW